MTAVESTGAAGAAEVAIMVLGATLLGTTTGSDDTAGMEEATTDVAMTDGSADGGADGTELAITTVDEIGMKDVGAEVSTKEVGSETARVDIVPDGSEVTADGED